LLGNGDATFQQSTSFLSGGSPLLLPIPTVGLTPAGLITAADLNNDGVPDLAIALAGNNSVSVLIGLGDGSFQPAMKFPTGAGPSGVATADFNRDGKLDLALADMEGNSVSVIINLTLPSGQ
jgi:hypothetical protein